MFETVVEADPQYICQLQKDLSALQASTEELKALKDDVIRRVKVQEGPQMKQLKQVQQWISGVDLVIPQFDALIIEGPQEIQRLRSGDLSFSTLGGRVKKGLTDVLALKQNGVFEAVVEKVVAEPEYISQLENDLLALQGATEKLKALKDDVIWRVKVEEGPQMKQLEQVKVWISRVDLMIPYFDSLIIEGPQEIQRLRIGDLSFTTFGERVAKALKDVVTTRQNGVFEQVVARLPIEPVVERPSEPFVGLESMLEEVWNSIMEEEVGVIGIYGMGGIGKTTLLIETNNRFLQSPHNFDFVLWVSASKDLILENMQEQIAEIIGLSTDPRWDVKKLYEKATIIFKVLKKKKFVLLLDDLWNRVELKDIGIPFPTKQNKCKVVFTTRSEEVCGEMEAQRRMLLKPFVWEQAWQLFQDKVGREVLDADPDIPHLAEDLCRECAGLPLALVTIGRAMACRKTPQEWKHAVQILRTSAIAFRGMGDKIFSKLKFSYDSLPNEKVKSCLLYCALFPEDRFIPKEHLMQKWWCESFWDDSIELIDAINEGYSIVATLVHACLLEEQGKWVKMHDMIRDMCLWIACDVEKEKENYFVSASSQLTKAPDVGKLIEVRRISLMQSNIQQLTEAPMTPSLLTLFLCNNIELKTIDDGFFQYMKALTVLDLSSTRLEVLPIGISGLVSLQYLDISSTSIQTLPWELTNLKKLKFFNLEYNIQLTGIPTQMMARFQLLQVLNMKECWLVVDTSMLEELECLENLKQLSITIWKDPFVLDRLVSSHKLRSCTQYLEVKDLNSSSSEDQDTAAETSPSDESIETKTKTLSGLHKSLRKRCFASLCKVHFENCHSLRDLTWLTLAPNLEDLSVQGCRNLEEILSHGRLGEVAVEGDQYGNLNAFSRLQVLVLDSLPQLRSICWKSLLCLYLNRIRVYKCPMLKKLPLNSGSAKAHNLVIEGRKAWWDRLEWEDDAARITFQSCFRDTERQDFKELLETLSSLAEAMSRMGGLHLLPSS